MAGILTKKFDIEVSNRFIQDVETGNTNYYVFVGRSVPWTDDNNPPAANQAVTNYDHNVYDEILYGKKINNTNIIPAIPRYNWTNNTFYPSYDKDDAELYDKQFYVYNSASGVKSVFKVIQSGSGNSVVAPSIISTNSFRTSDGYVWKYMYTITDSDMNMFGTLNYLPVTPNTTVEAAAIPGGIDAIKVLAPGTGWVTYNTGILQNVINPTTIVASSTASSNNDFYVNSSIYLKSGLGAGQIRRISDYDGATKMVVVGPPLDFRTNLTLANVTGTFLPGDEVTQPLVALLITSQSGYIQPGDSIIQSNSGATAIIETANTSFLRVRATNSEEFVNDQAIDANRGTTIGNNTVTTSNTTNTVTASVNSQFTTFYSAGQYIKVGTHFHRITSVANNTQLTVAGPFGATYTANQHYKINSAATVSGATNTTSRGTVTFADLNSVTLRVSTPIGAFDLGEIVSQTSSSTNGVVSFANSSELIISSVVGSGFVTSANIVGVSSNATANVTAVDSRPTITLQNTVGSFVLGSAITSQSSGNATVTSQTTLPNEQTEYVIHPTVTISGDGTNAAAYSVVNSTSQGIDSIVVFDPGSTYTEAQVTVSANPSYGSGVVLKALISPVSGHGSNAVFELGGTYVSVHVPFSNTLTESYNLPGTGKFRTVGIIKNPLFNDVFLSVSSYDRSRINLTGANTFDVGEVVYQANIATGVVVYSNTSFVELNQVKGSFDKTAANLTVIGLSSEKTSIIANVNVNRFTAQSNSFIVQEGTEAAGNLVTANSSTIRLTNVSGTFGNGFIVFDSASNAYANVTAINTANNIKPLTFDYFNQLARLSLSQNIGIFVDNEEIDMLTSIGTKFGSALVYSANNDIDLTISGVSGTFTVNELVSQSTSANGVVIGANSTYLKLTNVKGAFTNTSSISGGTSGATATIDKTRKVLLLADVDGLLVASSNNYYLGLTSGATGYSATQNTIVRPLLVRDTGSVLYTENISPVTRTDISREAVNLVIKF